MAESPRVAQQGRQYAAGLFFSRGMNSAIDPQFIDERGYAVAYNVLNRGGILSCRPGFKKLAFCLPEGPLQGAEFFHPIGGNPHLVVAVAGKVYTSEYPFTKYTQLAGINFRAATDRVYFAQAYQAAVRNSDGTISTRTPRKVLMMQDGGFSRAAYWDGSEARHLNPSPSTLETPPGGVMRWSGDRLWLAQPGGRVIASDIANPLNFSENEYLYDGRAFLVEGEVTALSELPVGLGIGGSPQLVVFTDSSISVIQSGIRQRAAWKVTQDFQKRVFSGVGCVGHRAVTEQYGQLWFYSASGLIALDSGMLMNSTSRIKYLDTEMAVSKAYLNRSWMQNIALASHGNALLVSVPSGAARNRHTWVLDQGITDGVSGDTGPAWASIWTGLRPVEWMTGKIAGGDVTFCLSRDYDGVGRIWQAFCPDNHDNGNPIEWAVETRAYPGAGGIDLAQLDYVEAHLSNLDAGSTLGIEYAGAHRGPWKEATKKDFLVPENTQFADALASGGTLRGSKRQSRTIRTKSVGQAVDRSKSSPEAGALPGNVDHAFQLRFRGTGPGAVRGFKMAFLPFVEPATGACSDDPREAPVFQDGTSP